MRHEAFCEAIDDKDMILAKFYYERVCHIYDELVNMAGEVKPFMVDILKKNNKWKDYAIAEMLKLSNELNSGCKVDVVDEDEECNTSPNPSLIGGEFKKAGVA
jgi:hypothetical protein